MSRKGAWCSKERSEEEMREVKRHGLGGLLLGQRCATVDADRPTAETKVFEFDCFVTMGSTAGVLHVSECGSLTKAGRRPLDYKQPDLVSSGGIFALSCLCILQWHHVVN